MKSMNVYSGLKKGVKWIEFSDDEKFIAAVGYDNVLVIWSTIDYSVIYNRVFECPIDISNLFPQVQIFQVNWCEMDSKKKHKSYALITAINNKIYMNYLDFDLGSM